MDFGIKGKVAVVTGAAGEGLGRADAIALADCGAKVAVVDIAPCDETVKIIAEKGESPKDIFATFPKWIR